MKVTAIVLAGGSGERLGSDIPKQYIDLGGKPVLAHSLAAFEASLAGEIIIVAGSGYEDAAEEIATSYNISKFTKAVTGGAERYDSVLAGLRAADGCDFVLIHDGARPFITVATINHMIEEVVKYGAAIAGMPSKDTVKIADKDGFIESTTDRSRTWNVATPQCFEYAKILAAYEKIIGDETRDKSLITDDAFVFAEAFPEAKIRLVEAGYGNIKITTPEDIEYARFLVDSANK